jgi:hypothetical protein
MNANLSSQAGDPHPNNCFVCDLTNETLLHCRKCSRSYHTTCLDPPVDHDMAPNSWTCPACALLDVQGATHTYLLDQPYERQDERVMTHIKNALGTTVGGPKTSKGANNARLSQHQNKDNPQSALSERGQSISRTSAADSQNLSLLTRLGLDVSEPLNTIETPGMVGDHNCKLYPISLHRYNYYAKSNMSRPIEA